MASGKQRKDNAVNEAKVRIPDMEDFLFSSPNGETVEKLAEHYRGILDLIGEDASREGLEKTPIRVAESIKFLTAGYHVDVQEIVGDALFDDECDEMVLVRDIELYSCLLYTSPSPRD